MKDYFITTDLDENGLTKIKGYFNSESKHV